jgi:hypothetical protein
MGGNLAFDLGHACERLVPACLEFAGDQPVGRIGNVVLAEGAIGRIARGFEMKDILSDGMRQASAGADGCSHRQMICSRRRARTSETDGLSTFAKRLLFERKRW